MPQKLATNEVFRHIILGVEGRKMEIRDNIILTASVFEGRHTSGQKGGICPTPDSEETVEAALPNAKVTLWRGTNLAQYNDMVSTRTLSGRGVRDLSVQKPSEEAAIKHVGGPSQPGWTEEDWLPEFTTSQATANSFGGGGVVVAVRVRRRYLRKASGTEFGWVAAKSAPFEEIFLKHTPQLPHPPPTGRLPNAS